jgi:hypothetical protein
MTTVVESGNLLDGDRYTWDENGRHERDLRPYPERNDERVMALEQRVAALERQTLQRGEQPAGRKIVMLHWQGGELRRLNATVMHVKPDAPAIAVRMLRARSAAWVDAEAAEGVIAEVLTWQS